MDRQKILAAKKNKENYELSGVARAYKVLHFRLNCHINNLMRSISYKVMGDCKHVLFIELVFEKGSLFKEKYSKETDAAS